MFVTLKKYRAAVAELATLTRQFDELSALMHDANEELKAAERHVHDYREIAIQQGEQMIRLANELEIARMEITAARMSAASAGRNAQFNPEQLRTLLQLCHPDKHGGKESAVQITQHINSLRK